MVVLFVSFLPELPAQWVLQELEEQVSYFLKKASKGSHCCQGPCQ